MGALLAERSVLAVAWSACCKACTVCCWWVILWDTRWTAFGLVAAVCGGNAITATLASTGLVLRLLVAWLLVGGLHRGSQLWAIFLDVFRGEAAETPWWLQAWVRVCDPHLYGFPAGHASAIFDPHDFSALLDVVDAHWLRFRADGGHRPLPPRNLGFGTAWRVPGWLWQQGPWARPWLGGSVVTASAGSRRMA